MKDRIHAFTKWFLSFFKKEWDLTDYPLRFRFQKDSKNDNETPPYIVQIINWWMMVGCGNSKEEAFEDLRKSWLDYKKTNDKLPRPGTSLPLQFAITDHISKYDTIAEDFFERVLGRNYFDGFCSDESSLLHFQENESEKMDVINKTLLLYNVDITDLYDGPLYKVFESLNNRK